jgi:hypothetical protein
MQLQERYAWEAIDADGNIFRKGEDLSKAVKFSLIPNGSLLSRHDLIGIKMKRRFCRGFIRGTGGGMKDYFHCVVCDGFRFYVSSINGSVLITPEGFELYI